MNLVEFARQRSRFYCQLYRPLPQSIAGLQSLPPVTKPELMEKFDEWVTDPTVTRSGVDAFITDKTQIGHLYRGRFAVWTTSGVTGTPGIFLHDPEARAIYDSLVFVRGWPGWVTSGQVRALLLRGLRAVFVVATEGHFAAISTFEQMRRRSRWVARRLRAYSALKPVPELVRTLNDFQPTVFAGYPSALLLLAYEQIAGRLHIHPVTIAAVGECLDPAARQQIEAAFGRRVHEIYGASEFTYMAFECEEGWLHVNADWVILEPVDERYLPVPPGQPARTVLVTNLANRIQPIIRYDLGDSITLNPETCACGNPLPAMHVEGRRDEILSFPTLSGETIRLLPSALATVVEETSGVQRFQVIQTAPTTLSVRLEVAPEVEAQETWSGVVQHLHDYLATHGLSFVVVQKSPDPPRPEPVSGKFRQVWSTVKVSSKGIG